MFFCLFSTEKRCSRRQMNLHWLVAWSVTRDSREKIVCFLVSNKNQRQIDWEPDICGEVKALDDHTLHIAQCSRNSRRRRTIKINVRWLWAGACIADSNDFKLRQTLFHQRYGERLRPLCLGLSVFKFFFFKPNPEYYIDNTSSFFSLASPALPFFAHENRRTRRRRRRRFRIRNAKRKENYWTFWRDALDPFLSSIHEHDTLKVNGFAYAIRTT